MLFFRFIETTGSSTWTLATHLEARCLATSLAMITLRGNLPRSGIHHRRRTQRRESRNIFLESSSRRRPRVLKIDRINFRSARMESGLAKLFILAFCSSNNLTMMQLSAVNKTVAHRQRKTAFLNKPSSSASTTQASMAANCNRARSHSDPPPDTNTSTYTH